MKTMLIALFCAGLISSALGQGATSIVLEAKDAKLKGNLNYNLQYKNIGNWNSVDSSATWDVKDISPGVYRVQITYGLNSTIAGHSFKMATGAESKTVSDLEGTGGWYTFVQKEVGTLKVTGQRTAFVITAKEIPGGNSLMNLSEVKLEKISPFASAAGAPTPPPLTLPKTTPAPIAAAIDKENAPVGEWIWMDKTVLKIEKDGSASRQELSGNQLVGKWTWDDKAKLAFHVDWNHKVTVSFTMTSDLDHISGSNSLGAKVAAVRAGSAAAKEPAVTTKAPPPASGSKLPTDAFGRSMDAPPQ